jgi:glucose-1-phosphate adenylyltransferase
MKMESQTMANEHSGVTQSKLYQYYVDTKVATEYTRKTLVLVLAGGEGSRLMGLTRWRAKPAVPFGGKYRIIDFALSNCINSGLRRIGVLTQYKSHSLIRHLHRAWGFMRAEIGEFVEILPAQQRTDKKEWYKGTADALFQNIDIMHRHSPDYVIVLGGDHIYTMDYSKMLMHHVRSEADLTVGCIEVPCEEARGFGVMSVDDELNIIKFTEKPAAPDSIPGKPGTALASMGIYIFSTSFLYNALMRDAEDETSSNDFGRDIIPNSIRNNKGVAYPFLNDKGEPAFWRDVGTIDSYWEANMDLCSIDPELNLYDRNWPVWTYQTQHPPAKFIFDDEGRRGEAIDSMVAGGVIISGARVKRSIIFFGTTVNNYSHIKDSVILPKVTVGKNCRLLKCVIDKGCYIADDTEIGVDPEEDRRRGFYITENGVTLVTPDMLGQNLFTGIMPGAGE